MNRCPICHGEEKYDCCNLANNYVEQPEVVETSEQQASGYSLSVDDTRYGTHPLHVVFALALLFVLVSASVYCVHMLVTGQWSLML